MTDLYGDLGVKPDATPAEIKAAGRKAQKKHHPDAGGDADKFVKTQTALKILSDPSRRAEYDRTGEANTGNPEDLERAKAMEVVAKLMNEVMVGSPRTTNLPKLIISKLAARIAETAARKGLIAADRDQKLAHVGAYRKRLKRKKTAGEPVLESMLDAQEREIRFVATGNIALAEREVRVMKRAQALVEGYEYEAEEAAQSPLGMYENQFPNHILDEIRRNMFYR